MVIDLERELAYDVRFGPPEAAPGGAGGLAPGGGPEDPPIAMLLDLVDLG